MSSSYLQFLGLAKRARKIVLGEQQIIKEIQHKKAYLILLASDTGEQTRKKITNKCQFYDIPYVFVDDRQTLSQAIGATDRVAVAIMDKGFARKLTMLLKV
ncbi:MAG TPA: YlxQ family RNA-binding protein [Bacillota bacterium]|nr:YlxQ family RNA-binding protein [Bacillota bacterium]